MKHVKTETRNTFLMPFSLDIPANPGIRKYIKYGIMSENNLGPNEWPPHQYGIEDDINIQCRITMASKKWANLSAWLFLIFKTTPYMENNNMGVKTNSPLAGLIKFPARASKNQDSSQSIVGNNTAIGMNDKC